MRPNNPGCSFVSPLPCVLSEELVSAVIGSMPSESASSVSEEAEDDCTSSSDDSNQLPKLNHPSPEELEDSSRASCSFMASISFLIVSISSFCSLSFLSY